MKLFASILASLLIAAPAAWGQTKEKPTPLVIDMTAPIHDQNGKPAQTCSQTAPDGKSCIKMETMTLGRAAAAALFAPLSGERNLTGEQKWARGALATRIENDKLDRILVALKVPTSK